MIFHKTVKYAEVNRFDDSVTDQAFLADFNAPSHDLRDATDFADCLAPQSYIASQALAAQLLEAGAGARQGSCRLIHAASGCLCSAVECAATTESRSGLRVTGPVGVQSRVAPDQRAGLRSRAWRYSAWRAARMA